MQKFVEDVASRVVAAFGPHTTLETGITEP